MSDIRLRIALAIGRAIHRLAHRVERLAVAKRDLPVDTWGKVPAFVVDPVRRTSIRLDE